MARLRDEFYGSVSDAVAAANNDAAERARAANATANAANVAATTKQVPVTVTVKPGDTLSAIAKKNNTTVAEILDLNPKFESNPKYKGGNMIWSGTTVNVGYKNETVTPSPTTPTMPTLPRGRATYCSMASNTKSRCGASNEG